MSWMLRALLIDRVWQFLRVLFSPFFATWVKVNVCQNHSTRSLITGVVWWSYRIDIRLFSNVVGIRFIGTRKLMILAWESARSSDLSQPGMVTYTTEYFGAILHVVLSSVYGIWTVPFKMIPLKWNWAAEQYFLQCFLWYRLLCCTMWF